MIQTKLQKLAGLLCAGACLISAGSSRGAEFWLRTGVVTNTMPDGQAVVFWAFAQDSANWAVPGALTVPGPQLNVAAGDSLILHVTNALPEPVSMVIPGQYGFDSQAPAFFAAGPYVGRARSLNHEAPPTNTATFTWNNVQSGTFLYHSGSHPSVQVQMGLYGALAVAAPGPQIYPGVPFSSQVTLLLSEVDARLHASVATGTFGPGPAFLQSDFTNAAALIAALQASANPVAQFVAAGLSGDPTMLAADLNNLILLQSIYNPTLFPETILSPTTLSLMQPGSKLNQDYTPTPIPFMGDLVRMNRMLLFDGLTNAGIYIPPPFLVSSAGKAKAQYFMINGQPYTNGQPVIVAGPATNTVLLRLLNAGMDLRMPTLNNGGDLTLVGEDGQQAPYPRASSVVMLAALKTVDALWKPAAAGTYAVYERHLGLVSGANMFGGALTMLSVGASVAATPPAFLVPPASQTVPEFSTATFTVVASGSGLTYQWLSNGVSIAGATGPSYSLANVLRTSSGAVFSVVVSSTGGAPVTSAGATLTVIPAGPTIVTQPATVTNTPPAPASFWVVAGGSTPFSYQWFVGPSAGGPFTPVANGGNISGATTSNLVFSSTSAANGGWYQVVVTGPVVASPGVFVAGAGATVTSIPAELKINPHIATQPASLTVPDLATATFTVVATGTGLTYQWSRAGGSGGITGPIPGATNPVYSFQAHLTDNGSRYTVVVTGDSGVSVTSAPAAQLTVTAHSVAPFITQQPVSVATNSGARGVIFTVVAYGDPAPGYHWQRYNGSAWVTLVNGSSQGLGGFAGVNTATLTVGTASTAIDLGTAGSYRVLVSNSVATVTSSSAGLTVTGTFAGDRVRVIPQAGGTSTPYPARTSASVPALKGSSIQNASVSMTLSHPQPFDMAALIALPTAFASKSVEFMAGVGPVPGPGPESGPNVGIPFSYSVTNVNLVFDDNAPSQISTNYWLGSGTYQPTVYPFGTNWMVGGAAGITILPFPVPVSGMGTNFASLKGVVPPPGPWRLYVNDNASDIPLPAGTPDGVISTWSLILTVGP